MPHPHPTEVAGAARRLQGRRDGIRPADARRDPPQWFPTLWPAPETCFWGAPRSCPWCGTSLPWAGAGAPTPGLTPAPIPASSAARLPHSPSLQPRLRMLKMGNGAAQGAPGRGPQPRGAGRGCDPPQAVTLNEGSGLGRGTWGLAGGLVWRAACPAGDTGASLGGNRGTLLTRERAGCWCRAAGSPKPPTGVLLSQPRDPAVPGRGAEAAPVYGRAW